jgi:Mg/Co/Ni transporter MgtE
LSAGFPTEGPDAAKPRAGQVVRTDAPTCELTDRLDDVRDRVRSAGWDTCVAVNRQGIVLGLVRGEAFDASPETTIEDVMEAGPATVRADEDLADLLRRLREEDVFSILVTTPEGRLIGLLCRDDAERHLAAARS